MADDYSQFPTVGGSAPAPSANPSYDPQSYYAQVSKLFPNAVFTGGTRTPQRNAQVGGVPDSMHLNGQALDFKVPGVSSDRVFQSLSAAGLPMTEHLDEGNHLHVGWGPKGGQAPAAPESDDYSQFPTLGAAQAAQPKSPTDYSAFPAVGGGAPSGAQTPGATGVFGQIGQTVGDLFNPGSPDHAPNALESGIMGVSNSNPVRAVRGAYTSSALNGFTGQPVRMAMEGMGVGMDRLKAMYPGQTDQWYQTNLHNLYGQALVAARQGAAQEEQSGQVAPDQPGGGRSILNQAANLGQKGLDIGAGITAQPEYFLAPDMAKSANIATRIATAGLANSAIGGASDLAAQGMDIAEGQQKDIDVKRSLESAATAGVFGAGMHGVVEATPFVAGLFKARGVDTNPNPDPMGSKTSPLTSDNLQMTQDDANQYHELLRTGDVDDIKAFFKGRNGPEPSYEDVNHWVNHRDLAAGNVEDTHLQPDFDYQAAYHKQAVEQHVQQQMAGWKNAPDVEVVNSHDDIQDPAIRAQAIQEAEGGTPRGFRGPDGKVRLYASNIPDIDTANAVLFHEALGHQGLANTFGDKLNATMQSLFDRNVGQFGVKARQWMADNPGAYGGSQATAMEEVLANASMKGPLPKSWGDAVDASVRQFGRKMASKMGLKDLNIGTSDGEVRQIISMAHDSVINGNGRDVTGNGFRSPLNLEGSGQNKFMFTGPKARTFDENNPTAFTPADGSPRNEISDRAAKLTGMKMGTLGGTLDHPALYDQYPELRNLRVRHGPIEVPNEQGGTDRYLGSYDPDTKMMHLDNTGLDDDPLRTVLHETQHAIQHIEGHLGDEDSTAHMSDEEYEADPREREARATEDRKDLTTGERAAMPLKFMKNAVGEEQTDPALLDRIDQLKQDPRFWSDPDFRKNVIELARTREPVDTSTKEAAAPLRTEAEYKAQQAAKFVTKEQMDRQSRRERATSFDYVSANMDDIAKYVDENYKPTTQSHEETRRQALEYGISPSAINDLARRNIGELAARVTRIGMATNLADIKAKDFLDRLDTPDWTIDDQVKMSQYAAERNSLISRFKEEGSELGRGLEALKVFKSYTNGSIAETLKALREAGEDGYAALADPTNPEALKFARSLKQALMGNNPNPGAVNTLVAGVSKPYWEQYLTSVHMNMMLSALSTHVKAPVDMMTGIARNIIEKVAALPITKVREIAAQMQGKTHVGMTTSEIQAHIYGLTRAVIDGEVYKAALHALKTGEGGFVVNGQRTPTNFNNQFGAVSNPRIPGVSIPTDAISAQDTIFRSWEMSSQLYALGRRAAIDQLGPKAKPVDIQQLGDNLARNPTAAMLREAHDLTDRTLLLNNNPLNNAIDKYRSLRPGLSGTQRLGRWMVGNLAPFIRVESNNLMNRIVQRSPLAFLDPYTRKEIAAGGARSDIALSKIAYGTALLGLYWAAAGDHKTTGEGPENVNKWKEMVAGGFMPRSVHENGQYTQANSLANSVNPFDLHNATATMVASAREAWENAADKRNPAIQTVMALGSVIHSLSEMTWLSDAAPVVDALTAKGNTAGQKINQFVGNEVKTFVPNALGQAARMIDPNQHDVVDPGAVTGLLPTIAHEVQSAIPFASKGLPTKYSVYGQPIPNGASLTGIHTDIPGLPGNNRKESTDPTIKELTRLASLTPAAIVTPVQQTVSVEGPDGETVRRKLSRMEFENYQKEAGQAIVEAVRQRMQQPDWSTMSDHDKTTEIIQLQQTAKADTRDKLFNGQQ